MQTNNKNLVIAVRRLLGFATMRTGIYETIGLILMHLYKVSLTTMRALLLQHSLEEGFNAIHPKLVKFLR